MSKLSSLQAAASGRSDKLQSRHIGWAILVLKGSLLLFLLINLLFASQQVPIRFDLALLGYILAGFVAQLIDGALGMAYGVSCSTLLMKLGIPPAIASASVHTAEVFTTGASGLAHLYQGNVDKKLFLRVTIPGVIGAMLGAWVVSKLINGEVFKPYVAGYLLFLGLLLVIKSLRQVKTGQPLRRVSLLGLVGGFLDAVGGGGWGPIVTSNLVRQGKSPVEAVGTVNTAEFFIAYFGTGVFLFLVGVESWQVILGLVLGGIIAAPLGSKIIKYISPRRLMLLVGLIIILTQGLVLSSWLF